MDAKPATRSPATLMAEFEAVALPHLDELRGTALRYTKNDRDAEDLVQETMMKAFTFFDRFEQDTNCRAWLFRILTNTFINQYRRRVKEREILGDDNLTTVKENFFPRDSSMRPEDPERGLAERVLSEDVQAALAALPYEFRAVIVLSDLLGFPYKDVAHVLGCPVGTVMSRLFRGRKLMRTALVERAYADGIIRDRAPYECDETNRTRRRGARRGAAREGAEAEAGALEPGRAAA
jgi:RNA polymerase sigma-70 factor (ECF subfamily)